MVCHEIAIDQLKNMPLITLKSTANMVQQLAAHGHLVSWSQSCAVENILEYPHTVSSVLLLCTPKCGMECPVDAHVAISDKKPCRHAHKGQA